MGKIATVREAAEIGGYDYVPIDRLVTKIEAEKYGCKVSGSYSNSQCVQVEDLSRDVKNISCTIQLGLHGYSGISGQMSFWDKDKETIIQISEFKNNSLVKTVPYVTENGIDYFVMNLAWNSCSPLKDGVVKVGYDVIANIIGGDVDGSVLK